MAKSDKIISLLLVRNYTTNSWNVSSICYAHSGKRGRGGGTVRGLGAYLQHGLGVMPGEIAAETGRLSASVPTTRRSSSRLGSGLLITTVVVQAYKEAGQTDRRVGMHAAGQYV